MAEVIEATSDLPGTPPVAKSDLFKIGLKKFILEQQEKNRKLTEEDDKILKKKLEADAVKKKNLEVLESIQDKIASLNAQLTPLQNKKALLCNALKERISVLSDMDVKNILYPDEVERLADIGVVVSLPELDSIQSSSLKSVTSHNQEQLISSNQSQSSQHLAPPRKRHSPSPPVYEFKRVALTSAFEKIDESRQSDYGTRGYATWTKPVLQTTGYSYYAAPAPVSYTAASIPLPPGGTTYPYSAIAVAPGSRDHNEPLHKSQLQSNQSHTFIPTHPPLPVSQGNMSYLVEHGKQGQPYPDDKYLIVRPQSHIPVHGTSMSIQQSQGTKHGSITSGYPVRLPTGSSSNVSQAHSTSQSVQQQSSHGQQSSQHQPSQTHRQLSSHIHSVPSQHGSSQFQQQLHHLPHHSSGPIHIQTQHTSQSNQRPSNPQAVYPHHLYYHNIQQPHIIHHTQHRPLSSHQSSNVQHSQQQSTQHSHGSQSAQFQPPPHHIQTHHQQTTLHMHQQAPSHQTGHSQQSHNMPPHHRHSQQQPHIMHHPQQHHIVRQSQPGSHHGQHSYSQHQHPLAKATHGHPTSHSHPQQTHGHITHGKLHQPQHSSQSSQQQAYHQQQQSQQPPIIQMHHHHNLQSQQQMHLQQSHHQEQQSHQGQPPPPRQSPQPVSSSQSVIRSFPM